MQHASPAGPGRASPVLVAKADASGSDPFESLARKTIKELAAAIYELLAGLPDTAWARRLRGAIRAGDWVAVQQRLQEAPYAPEDYRRLAEAVAQALVDGSALPDQGVPPPVPSPVAVPSTLQVILPPDIGPRPKGMVLTNPAAQRFVRDYTFDLVRGLVADPQSPTRQALSVVINEGLAQGHNPRRIADAVDSVMGLTDYQARVVDGYRKELEAWGSRKGAKGMGLGKRPSQAPGGAQVAPVDAFGRLTDEVQDRRLRDFRQDGALLRALQAGEQQDRHRAERDAFLEREITAAMQRGDTPAQARRMAEAKWKAIDQKLGQARQLDPERINKMVEAYARRWLKHRAVVIGRSESIRALNAGKLEQWRQSIAAGTVDGSLVFKRWLVAQDERLCPTCRGIARHYNAMHNGWGIPLEAYFDPGVLNSARKGRSTMVAAPYPPLHPNCRCTLLIRLVTPRMLGQEG